MFRVSYKTLDNIDKVKDFDSIEQALSFAESMFNFIAEYTKVEDEYGNILVEYEN